MSKSYYTEWQIPCYDSMSFLFMEFNFYFFIVYFVVMMDYYVETCKYCLLNNKENLLSIWKLCWTVCI